MAKGHCFSKGHYSDSLWSVLKLSNDLTLAKIYILEDFVKLKHSVLLEAKLKVFLLLSIVGCECVFSLFVYSFERCFEFCIQDIK